MERPRTTTHEDGDVTIQVTASPDDFIARATVIVKVELVAFPGDPPEMLAEFARREAIERLSPPPAPRGRKKGVPNRRWASQRCEWCQDTFQPGRGGTRFCSPRCRLAAHRAGLRRPEAKVLPPAVAAAIVAEDRALSKRSRA